MLTLPEYYSLILLLMPPTEFDSHLAALADRNEAAARVAVKAAMINHRQRLRETGSTYIMSQAPIRELEAARSSKPWVPEGDVMSGETFLSMGLAPVSLPLAEVKTGLQAGLVETVMVTPTAALAGTSKFTAGCAPKAASD